jgi:predicted NBD/HSP70 family sugar kinase
VVDELRRAGRVTLPGSKKKLGRINLTDVAKMATKGDTLSRGVVQEAGAYIGKALVSVVNLFNPSLVIVAGPLVETGELLLEPIRHAVNERALDFAGKAVRIMPSEMGRFAGAIGATTVVLERRFNISWRE